MMTSILIVIAASLVTGLAAKVFGGGKWDGLFHFFIALSLMFFARNLWSQEQDHPGFWGTTSLVWVLLFIVKRRFSTSAGTDETMS